MESMEPIQSYYPLGKKTLWAMIIKKCGIFLIGLPVLIMGLFILNGIAYNDLAIGINILFAYVVLLLVILIGIFIVGWLQYTHYGIFIGQEDLKIKKGLIDEEQLGIPYRHIKDVRIERTIVDQMLGISDIIVTVLGLEESVSSSKESAIVLPCIEKNIAMQIQDSILKKSEVEEVRAVS